MKIPEIAYNRFYEILIDHYVETEFQDGETSDLRRRSPQIWEVKSHKTDEYPVLGLFGTYSSENRIFYRVKCYVKDGMCDINEDLFIAALKYIDVEIPFNVAGKVVELTNVASLYFQTFLEKYYPEFIEKYKYFVVYDKVNGNVFLENSNLDAQFSENDGSAYDSKTLIKEQDTLTTLVEKYYNFIAIKEMQKAWNLLSPYYQKAYWKNNFDDFSSHNENIVFIKKLHVWDVSVDGDSASCKVYFESKQYIESSAELYDLKSLNLRELDIFAEKILAFKKKADIAGLSLNHIKIKDLLKTDIGELLRYRTGCDPEELSNTLDLLEPLSSKRLYTFSFAIYSTVWVISDISIEI
ncbi:hypothetical protein [Pedobacter sp. KACC 23697]|uniref:Uncharacterized protein n=1 Tax=Pedobacter sp. KACC 23697 TaxID=3149230 RepID=A0AAU7K5R8_9SPHI